MQIFLMKFISKDYLPLHVPILVTLEPADSCWDIAKNHKCYCEIVRIDLVIFIRSLMVVLFSSF